MNPKPLFFRYAVFLILGLVGINLFLPLRFGLAYPAPLVENFEPGVKKEHRRAIEETRPRLVLIGDSVLYEGVDAGILSSSLGEPVYNIPLQGSGTAMWYLLIDNVILRAEYRPKSIVILFRNTMLTVPQYRTTGKYFELLDDYATSKEPLLAELAFINQMNPFEKFARQYIPLYSERVEIRNRLDGLLRYEPASALLNCDRGCTDDAVRSIFGREVDPIALDQLMEDAAQMLYSPREMDFEKQVDDSFLPYMIDLALENGIQLIFIRTKVFGPEPVGLAEYSSALDAYLSEHENVILLDYSTDPRITPADYIDSLHMNADGRQKFSQILAEDFREILSR